jgi:hypothetical protein
MEEIPMLNAENSTARVVSRPHDEASAPHSRDGGRAAKCAACLLFAMAMGVGACESSTNATGIVAPLDVGMTSTVAPYYTDGNLTIYWEQKPVSLPVREGTGTEKNVSPYPAAPYVLSSDYQLEINYTVSNLDTQEHDVWVTVDPWNQFVQYDPGVTIVSDDETEPNLAGLATPVVLPAMSRVQGTFTADDTHDLAAKLAIAMAIMKQPVNPMATYSQATLLNHDFDTQYRTNDGDPLMAPYIPSVIAGLTGFNLGLQSYEQMNVAIEVTMQIVDNSGGKLIPPGESGTPVGPPATHLKVPGSVNL